MSVEKLPLKLDLGGGPTRKEGFTNVDIVDWRGFTDIVWDLTKIPYEFVKEPVDEILTQELLEHLPWRQTVDILKEWYRILKPGGKLVIKVPAVDKMMEMYVNKEICNCVKHKPKTPEDARGRKDCWMCEGKAKVNPKRWLMAFCGAQKHGSDFHKNVFTKEILEQNLKDAGFKKFDVGYDEYEWKLIVKAFK